MTHPKIGRLKTFSNQQPQFASTNKQHTFIYEMFFFLNFLYDAPASYRAHKQPIFFNVRKKQSMIILFLLAKILHTEFRK